MVARRATGLIKVVIDRSRKALQDHVDAVDRLAQEGRELLLLIDRTVIALSVETGSTRSVDRLFGKLSLERGKAGEEPARIITSGTESGESVRRRPRFD